MSAEASLRQCVPGADRSLGSLHDHVPGASGAQSDPATLFGRYLDFYRDTVLAKVAALPEDDRRRSRLPSAWTPLELLTHLVHMERRWFVWGFLAEDVDDPWGDDREGHWHVPVETSYEELAHRLREQGRRTSDLLAEHALDEVAPAGPRFPDGDPPTLTWICFHVLQEYARHAGHLDVAMELAGGPQGE